MIDFEVGGALHTYLEARFNAIQEKVELSASRTSVLEARLQSSIEHRERLEKAIVTNLADYEERRGPIDVRLRKLENWRNYVAGAVAVIGFIVAIGGRSALIQWLLPPAGPK